MNANFFNRIFGLSLASLLFTSQVAFAQQNLLPVASEEDPDEYAELADEQDETAVEDPMAKAAAFAPGDLKRAYTHLATGGNSSGHITYIDDPMANNNPNARIVVSHDYGSENPTEYSNHPLGVWYVESTGRWTIFNQDFSAIVDGTKFTVRIGSGSLHVATAENIASNWTNLDIPGVNGNPNAKISVTSQWGPGDLPGVYVNHPIGVWYTGTNWAVYTQDETSMPEGAAFNVVVDGAFTHTASASNTSGHVTRISNPALDGNPNAKVVVTANWNPGGDGGVYNDHNFGVWYDGSKWTVYNEDFASMPQGAAFNVLVVNPPTVAALTIKGRKLIVTGTNFSAGATIVVNGIDRLTKSDATSPTTKLIGRKFVKQLPSGSNNTIQVRNADGTLSDVGQFVKP